MNESDPRENPSLRRQRQRQSPEYEFMGQTGTCSPYPPTPARWPCRVGRRLWSSTPWRTWWWLSHWSQSIEMPGARDRSSRGTPKATIRRPPAEVVPGVAQRRDHCSSSNLLSRLVQDPHPSLLNMSYTFPAGTVQGYH